MNKDWNNYFTRNYSSEDITPGAIIVKLSGWGHSCGPIGFEQFHLLKDLSEFPMLHEALTEAEVADSSNESAARDHFSKLADKGLIDVDAEADLGVQLANFLEKQRQRCAEAGDDFNKLVAISQDYCLFIAAEQVMPLGDFLNVPTNQALLREYLEHEIDQSKRFFTLRFPGNEEGVALAIKLYNQHCF